MESNQGKRRKAFGGFLVGSAIFLVAAFVPIFRGERFSTTFLVLAIVFAVLGISAGRGSRKDADQPPAA
jgi:succinate-acetate transporter protein